MPRIRVPGFPVHLSRMRARRAHRVSVARCDRCAAPADGRSFHAAVNSIFKYSPFSPTGVKPSRV